MERRPCCRDVLPLGPSEGGVFLWARLGKEAFLFPTNGFWRLSDILQTMNTYFFLSREHTLLTKSVGESASCCNTMVDHRDELASNLFLPHELLVSHFCVCACKHCVSIFGFWETRIVSHVLRLRAISDRYLRSCGLEPEIQIFFNIFLISIFNIFCRLLNRCGLRRRQ